MDGLKPGKLPAKLLQRLLSRVPADKRVVVGPLVGEDAAVITMGEKLLLAKTDPITFATENIGWYAVHVNANDIAVMGGEPKWFLATALLPKGTTAAQVEAIFEQLQAACLSLDISLVGGHTEVTLGLDRPIIAGFMLGEAVPGELTPTGGAQEGDEVILTRGIAIEGTAALALEHGARLAALGIDPGLVRRAARYLQDPGISVVEAARAARRAAPVHAMHDPTEGGLATGLYEVAQASGLGLEIELDKIPVYPETAEICTALGIDPLGLLASGALIVAAPPESTGPVLAALQRQGIPAQVIGLLTPAGAGFRGIRADGESPLPVFGRDELARWLDQETLGPRELVEKGEGASDGITTFERCV